jgi:arsenate reductase
VKATIWHNPRCSKSRETLAILCDAGAEVEIVDYLNSPPTRERLAALYARAGLTPRDGLRSGEEAQGCER